MTKDLPFKHKGIMCAPFIGPVSIKKYLPYGQIEQVYCDGENYNGSRPCHYEWVRTLHDEWGWPIPKENLYKPYFGPKCGKSMQE